jgi:16S rRNA (adenine1518-N6/adenine1519-N6)-dimethyltransferase
MQQGKGFKHKKSLGQHFLKSEETAAMIVDFLAPVPVHSMVLEVGPGAGILTRLLKHQYGERLFVSEIDDRSIDLMLNEVGIHESNMLTGDFLRQDLSKTFGGDFVIIGNFPYNISSQIVFKMIEYYENAPLLVGMFQREMANRIIAGPGTKNFGVISAWAGLFYQSKKMLELDPMAFNPPPKVHSAVIRMKRRTDLEIDFSTKGYLRIVKAAFQQRRKRISNALKGIPGGLAALDQMELGHLRAEQLSIAQYIELTKLIYPSE